jgi:hypothetical protein
VWGIGQLVDPGHMHEHAEAWLEGKPLWVQACASNNALAVREQLLSGACAPLDAWQGRPLSLLGFAGRASPLGIAIGFHGMPS